MISLASLLLIRDVMGRQQLSADAPDLLETAAAVKLALAELDKAIAESDRA